MMPKRLLQLNVTANVGSTGRIAEEIGQVAMSHGFESYIAYGRACTPSASTLIKTGGKFDVNLHALSARFFDNAGLMSKAQTRRLVKNIEQIKPDIIHLHNLHGYWINYQILFEYLSTINVPVVWTIHDCWPFTGHCAIFSIQGCEKWQTGCHDCELKGEFPTCYLFDNSTRNYALKSQCFNSLGERLTIVPVSKWLGTLVQNSFLGNHRREVIYNGINTSVFKPLDVTELKKTKFGDKKIVLGVSDGWDQGKGLDDFIKLSKVLQSDYQIVLIGMSPEQITNLPSNVSGIERTSSIDELVEYYNMADVVLSLSSFETFGLTIVEGMSCGTPTIVYDVTAPPELIAKGVGAKVKLGDISAVARQIYLLVNSYTEDMAHKCRRHVLENFDSKSNYEKYFHLYTDLLNQK